ncbi:MAG: hypothetical protein ACRD26_21795 [Vicinamibacterales bacterium]
MERDDIQHTVEEALRRFGCNAPQILPVHRLQGDLGIDSIEVVEVAALVCAARGTPDLRIDVSGVQTVGDLIARVVSRDAEV